MKIPLSETPIDDREIILRKLPKENTAILLADLIESENDTEYRTAATNLQRHLLPTDQSNTNTYQCVHPDWFDNLESEIKVDVTTCFLCGYRQHCTLGKFDEREYIEIISLDDSVIPPKGFIEKNCFSAINYAGKSVVIDPFLGFSSKACSTRKLFLISQDEFNRRFPDKLNRNFFDAAIGYDCKLKQAIWPIDQLFLEGYELYKSMLKFQIIGTNNLHRSNLSIIDESCFNEIADQRGWLRSSSELGRDALSNHLKLLFSRLIKVLKSSEFNQHFERIALLSMTPNIDHPFGCNGTGYLHLAIRWVELRPEDLDIYFDNLGIQGEGANVIRQLLTNLRTEQVEIIDENEARYLPRLPMLAFAERNEIPKLVLEQPAGKIIDVIESNVNSSLLLIDSLGVDLLEVWRNY